MGREVARGCWRATAFRVAASDIRDCGARAAEIDADGGVARAHECDIRDRDAAGRLVADAERDLEALRPCAQSSA
jgi:hypothetical protein